MEMWAILVGPADDVTKTLSIRRGIGYGFGCYCDVTAAHRILDGPPHILVIVATHLAVFPVHVELAVGGRLGDDLEIHHRAAPKRAGPIRRNIQAIGRKYRNLVSVYRNFDLRNIGGQCNAIGTDFK